MSGHVAGTSWREGGAGRWWRCTYADGTDSPCSYRAKYEADEELDSWRDRMRAVKDATETLARYNTTWSKP